MTDAVRPCAHQGCGQRGGHGDEPREEGGPLGADTSHPAVPAHEADHRDHGCLPEQRGCLRRRGNPQEVSSVEQHAEKRGLHGRDGAHGRGQRLGSEPAQQRDGQDREADLSRQRAHRVKNARRVGPPPPLDGERSRGDEAGGSENRRGRPAPFQGGHEDSHDDGRAADEDPGDRRLRGAFGSQDGQVEAHHPDGGECSQAAPLPVGELSRSGRRRSAASPVEERQEQYGRQSVAQRLATGVRIVAEHAVGGEGRADQGAGESGEQRSAHGGRAKPGSARGGWVHADDARFPGGPA